MGWSWGYKEKDPTCGFKEVNEEHSVSKFLKLVI